MAYTIRTLLESGKFPEMQLLAENDGLDLEIKGIRIIEVDDMEMFLSGGELLLTSLKVYLPLSKYQFQQHLNAFKGKNVIGFIIKKQQEVEKNTNHYDTLMQFCKENHISIIEIPQSLYYWGIVKYVMKQVFDKETARLKYFKLTHDNFTHILLTEKHVTGTTEEILFLLDKMLGNPVALYYSNYTCFASTGSDTKDLHIEESACPYKPDIITKFRYLRQETDFVQYIVRIDFLGKVGIYLVITEQNEPLIGLDYMALENAIITLQYSFMGNYTQNEIEKKYQRDAEYSLLNGLLTSEEADELAQMLDLKEDDNYRVISFHTIPRNKNGKYNSEQMEEVGIVEGEIRRLLPDERIYRNMNQIVCIHREIPGESEKEFRVMIEELQQTVQKQIIHRKSEIDFQIGLGKIVKGYYNLKESFDDSKKAIEYIDIIRQIEGNNDLVVVDCSKLGFFQLFENIQDKQQLLTYIPETLIHLQEYDQNHKEELIPTLKCYLDNNQSIKKTAKNMFVHYRTISYRLEKIEKISGINFDNASEILAVRNGLVLLRVLETK